MPFSIHIILANVLDEVKQNTVKTPVGTNNNQLIHLVKILKL